MDTLPLAAGAGWLAVLQIIVVDLLLGADNAMVIALACRNLPPRVRRQGVLLGVAAVLAVRVSLTLLALTVLALPYLRLAGALVLLIVAVRLVRPHEQAGPEVSARSGLAGAIATIVAADAVMSVDNVLAVAAAADGQVAPIVLGLAVSIPVMVLFSRAILAMIVRWPWLVVAGGGLLGWIALRMAAGDAAVAGWIAATAPWLHLAAPAFAAGVLVAYGWAVRARPGGITS